MTAYQNCLQKIACLAVCLALSVVGLGVAPAAWAAAEKKPAHQAKKLAASPKKAAKKADKTPASAAATRAATGKKNASTALVRGKATSKTKQAKQAVQARAPSAKSPVAKTAKSIKKASLKPSLAKSGARKLGITAQKGSKAQPARLARVTDQPKRKASSKTMPLAAGERLSARARAPLPLPSRTQPPAVAQAQFEGGQSVGQRLGLRASVDALELNSSVALVVDQDTHEVLFSKNDAAVLPIASLTKLMTGLLIVDAGLPMDETITITQDDVDVHKGSSSRLAVGTMLSRGEMMHLALMSSENRAAHALARTFPGGLGHFISLMNSKARELGMHDTRYVDPTGLRSQNQSSARDLATLVSVAYERPTLRTLSTSPGYQLELGHRTLQFSNSNGLVRSGQWDIGLQKTGYIAEAGRCLVMQAKVAGRKIIMVLLDSAGKISRIQDAERVRGWIEAQTR